LGSCFEVETQLLISKKLNLGNQELIAEALKLIDEEEKMIIAFSKH
jgi:four helix bundle protein